MKDCNQQRCDFASNANHGGDVESASNQPTDDIVQCASPVVQFAGRRHPEPSSPWHKLLISSRDPHAFFPVQRLHCPWTTRVCPTARSNNMDLSLWIPITVALGLATLALMFLFVIACEKV